MAAGKEPAGSKNFPRSKPPRAGREETRAKEEGAHSAPAAPTWLHSGSLPPAGRSPASPPLPLPCPGKGSAERRTERSCARGRCPSCGRRTSPRAPPGRPRAPTSRWPERGWPQPWLAEHSGSQRGSSSLAGTSAPVRLLLLPAPGAARPREEPAAATAPSAVALRSRRSSLGMLGSGFPLKPPRPAAHLAWPTQTVNALLPFPS